MNSLEAQRHSRIMRVMRAQTAVTTLEAERVDEIKYAIDEAQRAIEYKQALEDIKSTLLTSREPLNDIMRILREVLE